MSEPPPLLITAGLPYANGDIHVGHIAGCYLPADINYRYQKLKNRDALFICGTDDHGVSIVLSAKEMGKKPQDVVEHYYKRQKQAFSALGINFDEFGSTSKSPSHKELSKDFFLKIHKKGYLVKKVSTQFYDESMEMFLPDRYVTGDCKFCGAKNQRNDQCEECGEILDENSLLNPKSTVSGKPAGLKDTTHWYLDLSKAAPEVERWLESADMRDVTRKYVKSLLQTGLVTRSMTRDLDWGIPVPLDDKDADGKVLYVWFDAPIGYISNTKDLVNRRGENPQSYKQWWTGDSEIYHYVGEDNTIFHCIIWIAMLSVHGGINLPKGVIVNKFMNVTEANSVAKMSKSKKNALGVLDYIEGGGDPDSLRYYLTKIAPETNRTSFDHEDFVATCNSDLANNIGNFISRSTSFCIKFFDSKVPAMHQDKLDDTGKAHLHEMQTCLKEVSDYLDQNSPKKALHRIVEFARKSNKYFDQNAPWKSVKEDLDVAGNSINISLQSSYFLGAVLRPFTPHKSAEILALLNVSESLLWEDALMPLKPGNPVSPKPPLFPRVVG